MHPFTSAELKHYNRHIILPEIGLKGQMRLRSSRVLMVGAGGLGCPALQYLAAAGVGHLGIIDPDVVDTTNLHRQTLYGIADVGRPKVEVAAERLRVINPHIEIETWQEKLTSANAMELTKPFDYILDGTDNFPTRYLVNDTCVLGGKTNVYASIFRFEGQVAVFNALREDDSRGPNYRDLFAEPPPPNAVPNCAEAGVFGVLPGIVGAFQANEVIKLITGIGEILDGKLMLFDALSMSSRILHIQEASPRPRIEELIDYEEFCGLTTPDQMEVKQISPDEFRALRQHTEVFVLDVREVHEYETSNIGGHHIPLREIEQRHQEIPRDKPVVVHCRSGQRSESAIRLLTYLGTFASLQNLTGGLLRYAEEMDPSLTVI